MSTKTRNTAARRMTIQRQILLDGTVSVEALARDLDVSDVTIRRDLSAMENDGSVRRTHGGAIIEARRGADQAFALREQIDADAKRSIARRALDLISPGQTLLVNDGSTVLALMKELIAAQLPATVATPGLNIATLLSENSLITAYLLGGQVRHHTLSTSGGFTENMLRAFNADTAFIAAEGLSAREGLTYSYENDANIARQMHEQAARTIVLATERKLGRRDRITALASVDIDTLVTDSRDPVTLQPLRDMGIEVISTG